MPVCKLRFKMEFTDMTPWPGLDSCFVWKFLSYFTDNVYLNTGIKLKIKDINGEKIKKRPDLRIN